MRREDFIRKDVESFKSQLCNLQKAYMVGTAHAQSHQTTHGRSSLRLLVTPSLTGVLEI